jgi:hypothetical protein
MGDIIKKFHTRSTPKEKSLLLRFYFDTGSPRTFVKQSIALKMKAVAKFPIPKIFYVLGNGNFSATHIISIEAKMLDIWVPHLCLRSA